MALSIGIVGLPNVGKSTLFNTLTKNKAEAANYPFCTIDPNVGVVKVPDDRLEKLAVVSRSGNIIPTIIEFKDIAGLVAGAHKGEGLGNKFLSHIRECDAICEVVRNFVDGNIIHVNGKVDPEGDRSTINLELIFADLATVEKRLDKVTRDAKSGDKNLLKEKDLLVRIKTALENEQAARTLEYDEDEKKILKGLSLLTAKPILYVLNAGDDEVINLEAAKTWDGEVIKINARIEGEIAALSPEDQVEFLKDLGIEESGLDKLIKASYKLLGLSTYFTSGEMETRAWTIPTGAKAPQAAGVIHTDFEKGFIRAEVIDWDKFVELGGEQVAREKGQLRVEGKDYVVKDGDVCHFLVNK